MSELPSTELAEWVIARSLANGGEFAEIFAERANLQMSHRRVEGRGVVSGGEQGAGLQVVSGGVTYFAHVDGLAEDRPDARRG